MKKKRVPKVNTSRNNEQKAVTPLVKPQVRQLDTYMNHLTFTEEILTTTGAEKLARDLVLWARTNEEALKIAQFLAERGINRKTWSRWCEKFQILADANDYALMIIGNRREVGLLTRKFDSQSTTLTMLMYDPEWRQCLQERAKIMHQEGLASGQRIVVIEKFPDSPLVPVKIEQVKE